MQFKSSDAKGLRDRDLPRNFGSDLVNAGVEARGILPVRARRVLAFFAVLALFAGTSFAGACADPDDEVLTPDEVREAAPESPTSAEPQPPSTTPISELPTTTLPTVATAATTTPTATTTGRSSATFPLTLTTPSGDSVTLKVRPERVISLSPTHTEMLFAIGAGAQIVAVDEYSYYPPEAPVTDLSGFTPNIEAIAGYQPDLVVVSYVPGDLAEGLAALGVPMLALLAAADVSDVYEQILLLGEATDNEAGASELADSMQARFNQLSDRIAADAEATYYHELDSNFYSVTSDTFIGRIYSLAGLRSIADEAEEAGGYPQLSAEFILEADPDFIFVTSDTPEAVLREIAERPGWSQLTAVEEERVVVLPANIASRWGPRIIDFFEFVITALS